MFSAIFVAAYSVGYLFIINDALGIIARWVCEHAKPDVAPRRRDLLLFNEIDALIPWTERGGLSA
jgi:hypothetical protein